MSTSPRIAVVRTLSTEEQAFLAWFFVASARPPYGATGEYADGLKLKIEWEEMTGQELPDDFLNLVCGIHDCQ